MRRLTASLVTAAAASTVLTLIPLAAASSASAAVTQAPSGTNVSPNWAGYYAVPVNGHGPEAVRPRAAPGVCYDASGRCKDTLLQCRPGSTLAVAVAMLSRARVSRL